MHRHHHLFEAICTFDNLLVAARKAQRGKRYTEEVAQFNHRVESQLLRLRAELRSARYSPGQSRQFSICDPKPRIISAAPYRDRVVHNAICNIIEPIFERTFISDSYACRAGKVAARSSASPGDEYKIARRRLVGAQAFERRRRAPRRK